MKAFYRKNRNTIYMNSIIFVVFWLLGMTFCPPPESEPLFYLGFLVGMIVLAIWGALVGVASASDEQRQQRESWE